MHNYLPFDIMTSGKIPEYFINFIEKRNINISFSQDEKMIIQKASKTTGLYWHFLIIEVL